jgi:hypothetical protein
MSSDALPAGCRGNIEVLESCLHTTIPKRIAVALLHIANGSASVVDSEEEFCLALRKEALKILSEN